MTLLETLVAVVIMSIVMASLVGVIWQVSLRSQRLTSANQAMESVLTVHHALTEIVQSSTYMQIQYTQGNIALWLFRGGQAVGNVINPSQPWLYNTTTISSNAVSSGIQGAQCFYVFDFAQQSSGLWNVYAAPAKQAGSMPNFGGQPLAQNVNVQWYLPNLSSASSSSNTTSGTWGQIFNALFFSNSSQGIATGSVPSGTVINGFILRLSATYKAPNGQVSTYALTSGYHDANQG